MATNNANMTTKSMAVKSTSIIEQSTVWLSILVFVINSIFLVYFHCQSTISSNSIISSLIFTDRTMMTMNSSSSSPSFSSIRNNTIPLPVVDTSYNDQNVNATTACGNDTMSIPILSSNENENFQFYYPNIDMILFTSMIVMAFELLDYITRNSGSTY